MGLFCPKCGEMTTKMDTNASKHRRACDTFNVQHFFVEKQKNSTQKQKDVLRPVPYVALSLNLIQTNLIKRIKCDGRAWYETN